MAGKGKHVKKDVVDKKKVTIVVAIAVVAVLIVTAGVIMSTKVLSVKSDDNEAEETVAEIPEEQEEVTEPEPVEEPEEEPEPEEPEEPEEEPEEEPTEEYDGPVNPLTGLPVSEDISGNRPYAVMVNNLKIAVPQNGIGKADIIYETLAEGGITRLVAVYQDISVVDTIGSVRSSRPYFLDLAQGLDAIYIHAGGSDAAYTQIKARGVTNIDGVNGTGETFYRDAWRRKNMGYEHSLMLNTTLLPEYVTKYSLRTTHSSDYVCNMTFSDEPNFEGGAGENVIVTFSNSKTTSFAYDKDTSMYTVTQYGSTMTDANDNSDVTVRNLVILYASISKISGDTAGRLQMTLTGTGKGYFVRDGVYTEITWSKDSYTSQFVYTLSDGTPVEFGTGSSYISIIPISDGKVSFN